MFSNRFFPLIICLFWSGSILAQEQQDTSSLHEVVVTVYPGKRALFNSPATIGIIDEKQLRMQPGYSLVPALNTLPGVRMEERSPGSYRLSIRGSLLRSPFGIRNVKIYLDEFPLTDAGGNTYLNVLDPGNVNSMEVLKGPEGSLFGANTGGVLLVHPLPENLSTNPGGKFRVHLSGGSYGLFQDRISWEKKWNKYQISVSQNFQRSDGYRVNSSMKRNYVHAIQTFNYNPKGSLKLLTLYSDLEYRTPGGLTLDQFNADPRAARPATSKLPGASQQHAGVVNKTLFGGLSHGYDFGKNIRHVIAVFGSKTHFENPFITNYEFRKENTLGVRTFVEMKAGLENFVKWNFNLGMEWQQTNSNIANYGNRSGSRDTAQVISQLNARQYFYFARVSTEIGSRLVLEGAMSIDYYRYWYKGTYPVTDPTFSKMAFSPQLLPRLSASFKISEHFSWRASASKGYSPPTIAEIRPSDNIFHTDLRPEEGWNYETGLRLRSNKDIFWMDATIFYYRLQHAIVSRNNNASQQYFVNSGGTRQPGLETQMTLQLIPERDHGWLRSVQLRNSFTYYHFTFSDYRDATNSYSGNHLTGVPPCVVVSSVQFNFPARFYFFVQHNYTGKIPVNDANTAYANSYNLLQAKAGWTWRLDGQKSLEIFAGADNLLNQTYSLGNDLNAAGSRYYNAAPKRNGYAGINLTF